MNALITPLVVTLAVAAGAESSEPAAPARGTAQVIILTPEGMPVAGARVTFSSPEGAAANSVADGEGILSTSLPTGVYSLQVRGPKGQVAGLQDISIVGGEVTEILLVLGRAAMVEAPESAADVVEDSEASALGDIVGSVTSPDARPVAGARVLVRGYRAEAVTDENGQFALSVPAGAREITIIHPDFSKYTQTIDVGSGTTVNVAARLDARVLALQELVVSAPKVEGNSFETLAVRRNSANVMDLLGAEQISKTGDSDAASALRRVTGITVVGGRFVYVRGLGERYSSTLLNGSTLPSPDPERRVVPLDLFPSSILGNVSVQKTYSPNLPGEFGGGTVRMETQDLPSERQTKISISGGMLTGTTLGDAPNYKGGAGDMFGFGKRSRALPGFVADASSQAPLRAGDRFTTAGYSSEQLETFGEAMNLDFGTSQEGVSPNGGLSVEVGTPFKVLGKTGGARAAVSYSNSFAQTTSQQQFFGLGADELQLRSSYELNELQNNIALSVTGAAGMDFSEDQSLRYTVSLNRISTKGARVYEGYNDDSNTTIRVNRLRWVEQMLVANQLSGEHLLHEGADLRLNWRYMLSVATRDEPDRRQTRYDQQSTSGEFLLSTRPGGNERFYSDLNDLSHDVGMDFSLPVRLIGDNLTTLRAGLGTVFKDREVSARRFAYQLRGFSNADLRGADPSAVFSPDTIGPNGYEVDELTLPTDNYTARQSIASGYVMAETGLHSSLTLMTGLRVEHSRQQSATFELFNPDFVPQSANLNTTDLLPAATLSWTVTPEHIIRVAASRTVSRPDFRELSPASFFDVEGGRVFRGNTELQRASLFNADVRWEWYPSENESISIAGFYKRFQDPIELTIVPGAELVTTFDNVQGATNLGAELEARKNLSFIARRLRDLYIAGNVTAVYSRVTLDPDGAQTSRSRPLQGQSPYVLNGQFGYDGLDTGTSVTLLYNVFGRRIAQVGAQGLPDVYEEPVHQLDLTARQALPKDFAVSFKAKNLIDPVVKQTQGAETTLSYRRGRLFSLALSKTF